MTEENEEFKKLKDEFNEFTYIVSHDMRAPLRAISSITEWIEDDMDDSINEEIRNNFKLLKQKVTKMDFMIAGLVDLSRVETRDLEISSFNVNKLANEVKEEVTDMFDHLTVVMDVPDVEITTFKLKLYQVLLALLRNVGDHNADRVTVHVNANVSEKNLILQIMDDGKHVDEDPKKWFRTFYSRSKKEEHIGIGLTLTKKIIENINGSIAIENNEPGLLITLNWPLN